MWNIKEIKKAGKKILKSNLWTLLFLTLFMSVAVERSTINTDGYANLKTAYNYIIHMNGDTDKNQDYIVNEYVDQVFSQVATGNVTGLINNYNEKHNVTKGFVYASFNIITKGQQQIQNTFKYIMNYTNLESLIIIVESFIAIAIRVFIVYPIRVGENRIYLESMNYKKTRIKRLLFAFREERYLNSVKAILLMEVRKFLWNLTIVGGIVKNYSYKMVTYVIAENPSIKAKDAIKISEEMMKGNKFKAFKLDMSFLGWTLLQYLSFGILGIYVSPYYMSVYTELYRKLREDYIKNQKYAFKLLNDQRLYEVSNLEKYPDKYEIQRKKIRIDYNRKYELTSIILFFFIFSFIGWIWEVSLYLFRDGILVNRGTLHGPWLPIYGWGCTIIILLTRFKKVREILKNPTLTFIVIMALCTIIEYVSSWYIEATTGLRYWDYTGIFLNIKGRVCFECSILFGLGGAGCVYFVAPFLERKIQRLTTKVKVTICTVLVSIIMVDQIYSLRHPNVGTGITVETNNTEKN